MKKICLINGTTVVGGGPLNLLQLLESLDKKEWEPVICSYNDGPYWKKFERLTTKAYSIPLRKLSLSSWMKLRSILNKEKPDLIHTHGKGPGLYGRIAGWLFGIPVIHSFHGFHYYDLPPFKRRFHLLVENILALLTPYHILSCQGERDKARIIRLLKDRKITVIHNGLRSSKFKELKPNKRKIQFGEEERIKMTRLRQTIAKRLKEAQENAAILTTFNEVDMSGIISMRKENQEDFHNRYNIKLGFMSFFVKACVVGLKLFPAINAEIEGQDIIYKNYYNISFAVGTEKGLVVPVLKNADEMSFADIENEIKKLSDKAKNGSLTIEDLQGGTFTISNGGVYGSMLLTPILNPPQSGVLGMHNIVERPVAENGDIKIKPVMYLALSYDHRIIDGKDSVSFLKTIKENVEDPRRLFLNI